MQFAYKISGFAESVVLRKWIFRMESNEKQGFFGLCNNCFSLVHTEKQLIETERLPQFDCEKTLNCEKAVNAGR